jgi:hypothetical protein
MNKLYLLFICSFFYIGLAAAQSVVNEDSGIRSMMDKRKELNFKKDRYIKAWSIQIMVSRDKIRHKRL